MFIELGSNIKNIDDKTFSVASGQVRVSYRNGVSGGDLICENGVVLNADRTKLYRYCNFQAGEYTIREIYYGMCFCRKWRSYGT